MAAAIRGYVKLAGPRGRGLVREREREFGDGKTGRADEDSEARP